jgi:hypothetical protein
VKVVPVMMIPLKIAMRSTPEISGVHCVNSAQEQGAGHGDDG